MRDTPGKIQKQKKGEFIANLCPKSINNQF